MKYLLCVFIFISSLSCSRPEKADLIIHHARIYTVDSAFTIVEAMAISKGIIIATGTNDLIQKKFTADSVIDAKGAAVYPGFNDAHAHFWGYAMSLLQVDLTGTKSWNEVVERTKTFAAGNKTAWISGRGWDQNDWQEKSFPNRRQLDSLFPNTPVLLERIDGHAAIANRAALDAAGIKAGQTLTGGTIEVLNGQLTGILIDNAVELASSKVPRPSPAEMEAALLKAQANCITAGLTSITDCGLSQEQVQFLDKLYTSGKLHLRLNIMLSDSKENIDYLVQQGPVLKERYQVRGIKFYGDGALGSRGACLLHDYEDRPGWKGFMLKETQYFAEQAAVLANTNIQMCTHAIGDSANRSILRIYAAVLKGKNDKRWRIEHAQVVDAADFGWFGENNIVPSVQPTHATSDMYWAKDRLGDERVKNAYAYQQLLKQNGWMPLGTDFPVEHIDPLRTFYAAVARRDTSGYPADGFQPENALSREEALRGMTIWAARASFEEKNKGSLETGKAADFIITNEDLMRIPEAQVLHTKVLGTFISGARL